MSSASVAIGMPVVDAEAPGRLGLDAVDAGLVAREPRGMIGDGEHLRDGDDDERQVAREPNRGDRISAQTSDPEQIQVNRNSKQDHRRQGHARPQCCGHPDRDRDESERRGGA